MNDKVEVEVAEVTQEMRDAANRRITLLLSGLTSKDVVRKISELLYKSLPEANELLVSDVLSLGVSGECGEGNFVYTYNASLDVCTSDSIDSYEAEITFTHNVETCRIQTEVVLYTLVSSQELH